MVAWGLGSQAWMNRPPRSNTRMNFPLFISVASYPEYVVLL